MHSNQKNEVKQREKMKCLINNNNEIMYLQKKKFFIGIFVFR